MSAKEKFLCFVSQFDLTLKKVGTLLSLMEQPSMESFLTLPNLEKFIAPDTLARMHESANERSFHSFMTALEEKGIQIVTKFSDQYPEKLRELPDAPYYLFCKGDLQLLSQPAVGIVGSRTPTNYGRFVTDKLAGDLARKGFVIVSGLAYGVDSIAHRKALEVGGKTIAVLGGGFNHIYPADHTDLAATIAEKGLLVSEYCPSVRATKYTFPQRNRIVAGLADGVLITEAGFKSGTVHTKDFALDYGREVFAVPGNINSDKSELTNDIIKSGQGAAVTCAQDIVEGLALDPSPCQSSLFSSDKSQENLNEAEAKIVECLQNGEKDMDSLSDFVGLNINSLNSYLTTMEIRGIIRRMPGGTFMLMA